MTYHKLRSLAVRGHEVGSGNSWDEATITTASSQMWFFLIAACQRVFMIFEVMVLQVTGAWRILNVAGKQLKFPLSHSISLEALLGH